MFGVFDNGVFGTFSMIGANNAIVTSVCRLTFDLYDEHRVIEVLGSRSRMALDWAFYIIQREQRVISRLHLLG